MSIRNSLLEQILAATGGSDPGDVVNSAFGRSGDVVAESGDYSAALISSDSNLGVQNDLNTLASAIAQIPSALTIERLLDGLSTASNQYPTGLGEANLVQIEFGPAVNTASDPVNLLADGTLQINEAGLYRLKISTTYGRDGAAAESELRFRALVNGIQTGQSIGVELDNDKIIIPYTDEAWLYLPAGLNITYEVMRDSSGNDSGGLKRAAITAATAPSWNPCTCAAIRVERFA